MFGNGRMIALFAIAGLISAMSARAVAAELVGRIHHVSPSVDPQARSIFILRDGVAQPVAPQSSQELLAGDLLHTDNRTSVWLKLQNVAASKYATGLLVVRPGSRLKLGSCITDAQQPDWLECRLQLDEGGLRLVLDSTVGPPFTVDLGHGLVVSGNSLDMLISSPIATPTDTPEGTESGVPGFIYLYDGIAEIKDPSGNIRPISGGVEVQFGSDGTVFLEEPISAKGWEQERQTQPFSSDASTTASLESLPDIISIPVVQAKREIMVDGPPPSAYPPVFDPGPTGPVPAGAVPAITLVEQP